MRVFVTGGSSPLGEVVIPRLAAVHDVFALARSAEAVKRVEKGGATAVLGALEIADTWAPTIRDADSVVHLAGLMSIQLVTPHLEPGQNLTVLSSASVRSAEHPKSSALRAAELRLTAAKPEGLVVLRPTMIYGSSRDRNVRLLARLLGRLPAVPWLIGGGLIQPVFADDVGDAVMTTLGMGGLLELDFGGPVAIRLGTLVAEIARLLDTPVIPIPVPVRALAYLGEFASSRMASRALHALAMLRTDRSVAPATEALLGHPPTRLVDGLVIALARYSSGVLESEDA